LSKVGSSAEAAWGNGDGREIVKAAITSEIATATHETR
jgi:hypothetical protein